MKITKNFLKKIIMEELSGGKSIGSPAAAYMQPSEAVYLKNYPSGERPDNSDSPKQFMREPYETLGVETQIEDGEVLIIIGKIKYKLIFDNEDLTSGHIIPCGEYKFTIRDGKIDWFDNTPTHVRFDAQLDKQIKDFSGREE